VTLDAAQQKVMDSLLIEAVDNRDLPRMKIYTSKGANVNLSAEFNERVNMNGAYSSRGLGPLYHYMLENSFTTAISDFFFEQGVKVDVKNFNGNTPLMLAVKNGSLPNVRYFLSKGADPMATNKRGDMVLEEARKLQTYHCSDRQNIIDALVQAIDSPAEVKPAPAAKPAADAETQHDIQTLKPLELVPHRKGIGFNL
jgi:ankyrin repeat protein